jgi:2-C-methyl-D-erythritol 4-phosphate cytidylyltransferase
MMSEADQKGIHYSQSVYTLANELGHVPLYIAEGEMINLKLTLPSDINLFQTILHAYKD